MSRIIPGAPQAMSYDKPLRISHAFGHIDYGNGNVTTAIRKPRGARFARIVEICLACVETFTQTTTAAHVLIGTASDDDKFADLNIGALANTDAMSTNDDTDAIKAAGYEIDMNTDGDSGAAISQLEVIFQAPTGGTPAGMAYTTIVIDWY